jgi:hypothetical protein
MLHFLNKSYPFNDDLRQNAKVIVFVSIGVLAFLVFFQPVEIEQFSKKEILHLLLGFAVSTFIVLTLNLIILPTLIPRLFTNKKWTIKKEISWNIWMLISISGSYLLLYSELFGIITISFLDIVKIVLLGFLPVAALIVINQDRLLRTNLKTAQDLTRKLTETKNKPNQLIHIESDYKKDTLSVRPSSIVLIQSADNYIEVTYEVNGVVKKTTVRSTLKKVERQIQSFRYLLRCHRAYIININYIVEVTGNSQGYKLDMEGLDRSVSVSQKYIHELNKRINQS